MKLRLLLFILGLILFSSYSYAESLQEKFDRIKELEAEIDPDLPDPDMLRTLRELRQDFVESIEEGDEGDALELFLNEPTLSLEEKNLLAQSISGVNDCGESWIEFACSFFSQTDARDAYVQRSTRQLVLKLERELQTRLDNKISGELSEIVARHTEGNVGCGTEADCKEKINSIECEESDSVCKIDKKKLQEEFKKLSKNIDVRSFDEAAEELGIEDFNKYLNGLADTELKSLAGFENFQGCNGQIALCSQAIEDHSCTNADACQESKLRAKMILSNLQGEFRIERNAAVIAGELLNINSGTIAFANYARDFLGIDFTLLKRGSSLDKLLRAGTTEQICLAKVESFVSINGLEVEGSTYDVQDAHTGLISRQKACDQAEYDGSLEFEVCADIRAERSGIFFNNTFSLISHVYVYNPNDYAQNVVLSAQFLGEVGSEEFNVFNRSKEIRDTVVRIEGGSSFATSIYLSEVQPLNGEAGELVNGNILLSVFKSESENSALNSANFEYAIDYPVVEMGSGPLTGSAILASGVEFPEGTVTYSSSLVERISFR